MNRVLRLGVAALGWALLCGGCAPPPAPACEDAIGCLTIAPGEPVRLAVMQDMSGPASEAGLLTQAVIELAVADRDATLLGHPIELVAFDSKCTPEGGSIAALSVAADRQTVGALGPSCSSAALTAGAILSDAGMVTISTTASAPSLTGTQAGPAANFKPGFLRTAQNDILSGRAAAAWLYGEAGARRVATIDSGDLYTASLVDAFAVEFEALGGDAVVQVTLSPEQTELGIVVDTVADAAVDGVFLPLFEDDVTRVVKALRADARTGDLTLVTRSPFVQSFVDGLGADGVGLKLVYTIWVAPDEAARDAFVARVSEEIGPEASSSIVLQAYDAATLLLDAIGETGDARADGTLVIGRQALRDALYAPVARPYIMSTIRCTPYGDCGPRTLGLFEIREAGQAVREIEAAPIFVFEGEAP